MTPDQWARLEACKADSVVSLMLLALKTGCRTDGDRIEVMVETIVLLSAQKMHLSKLTGMWLMPEADRHRRRATPWSAPITAREDSP